ncbi:DUF6990 domain-containing protein [Rhodophyticola porphyridii]|uniref:Uncharacterized protein n=1 Tax=Rhodophyticola porphyridii TaxID=1852017 RepID=A0A3L9Y1R3_9RHOB|nr:hypothetical protein [Rhodophyticola porphyridii]RMA41355.1 hypothetical protein D9R08_13555 [Rhodophyticola porphyridii]
MNTAEVAKKFKDLGWKNGLDYDRFSLRELEDRTVITLWKLRNYGPTIPQVLETQNNLQVSWFSDAVKKISTRKSPYETMLRHNKYNRTKGQPVTPDMVEAAAEQAIAWAKVQDLDAQLQAYRVRPLHLTFDEYGPAHLAARALCGDIDQLRHYQDRYAAGHLEEFGHGGHIHPNRLHINTDTIARAIEYAEGMIARGEARSPTVAPSS